MMTTADLVRLPWTFQGPVSIEEDGTTYWEVRIAELPDFVVIGRSREEVYSEINPALEAFLESYTSLGQEPPLPAAVATFSKGSLYAWRIGTVDPRATRGPNLVAETSDVPPPGVAGSYVSRELAPTC